jgi:hypothetical protein
MPPVKSSFEIDVEFAAMSFLVAEKIVLVVIEKCFLQSLH